MAMWSSQAELNAFLESTYGIKGNEFPAKSLATAARSGGTAWGDFCDKWGQSPKELAGLRGVLLAVKKASAPAPASLPEKTELSPRCKTASQEAKAVSSRGGMPDMHDETKGETMAATTARRSAAARWH